MPSQAVLLVEDEWLLRVEMADALAEAGYVVTESSSGEDAIARVNQGVEFDLLITDIRLTGPLSGWDVATAWRTRAATLPVIYVSANNPEDSRRVAGSLFFSKPVKLPKILEACQELLQGR